MAFHEVRFPDNISRGARGGPERRTQIVEMASGDEERNGSWADSRRRYDASYGIRKADDLAAVTAFFEARRGRLYGFRWKDWADYKSGLPSASLVATDQPIGISTGAATTFQLVKLYTSGAQSWTRTITKPVAGTVVLALNGVTQITGWTVNTATGVITFAAAPAPGVAITAGFEFDVPVRFDTDTLDVTLDVERLGSITSIPLIEVRR
ncbi:phage distal tail protein, Rcc01695 family [Pseudogemmobacter sp. W21_MBD1_M6]|uniref:phage distal tail protein, Rcc01695 family n=1 Tax=Pseudogemmobacter sp. W21_MBD1_M6 TaxID=3240271 RepID=UPI003F9DB53F